MADLSVIYSKTPRGLRARASLIGGLSSHLMKVLSLVDGTSKAEAILLKFDHLTVETLLSELAQLEQEGYIKASGNTRPNEEWSPTVHFTPMVVEEYQSEEELEAIARTKAKAEAKLAADRKANAEAAALREAQRKVVEAEEAEAKAKAKAKAKAEEKVKERLEAERIAKEAEEAKRKVAAEAKKKADEKAKLEQEQRQQEALKAREEEELAKAKVKAEAKMKERLEAERIAKEAEEARIKAEAEAMLKIEEKARLEQEERQRAALKAREEEEQAQAKAEADAKENTRRELERIAREAEEAQKKAEAEAKAKVEQASKIEQAKLEAERIAQADEDARLEAEAKAKAEKETKAKEKEKARLEIEHVLREAEEKRKESANKAKEEKLEAKRKAKADEEARIKAERKAKVEAELLQAILAAEEKVKVQENEGARLEMAHIALETEGEQLTKEQLIEKQITEEQIKTAESTSTKAAQEAQIEAERIKARLEAEENEKAAAIEKTRLEMARISSEADALRRPSTIQKNVKAKVKAESAITITENAETLARAKAEERARKEAERLAEEEEELAQIEAEEKAKKTAKKSAKKETKPDTTTNFEDTTKVEIESQASQVIQEFHVAKEPPSFRIPAKAIKRWVSIATKVTLIYLPLVLLLIIGVMHFINISMLATPIEKLISESLGDAVTIQEVHVSLLPEPHLVLGDVTIGRNPGSKIESVYIVPTSASFFDDVKIVKSIVIEGMQINQDNFKQQLQWINGVGKAKNLKIEDIHLKDLTLKIRDLELGIFDGKLELSEARALMSIDLISSDHTLNVQILPLDSANNIKLNGTNWALPTNPKIVFNLLKASGSASQDGVNFSKIIGEMYSGSIAATALLDWSSQWNASGNFDLREVSSSQLLTAFNSPVLVEGKLNMTGNFATRTTDIAKFISAADITADFALNNGSINGIELTRALLARGNQSLMGDATQFDKLVGSLQVNNSLYQYRTLVLQSPQLNASGSFDISPNQQLSGKISADLTAQSRHLHANISLTGSSSNIRSQ